MKNNLFLIHFSYFIFLTFSPFRFAKAFLLRCYDTRCVAYTMP